VPSALQPSRYSFPLQTLAPLIEQSRAKQTLLVQLVQPAPYFVVHDVHVPKLHVVHPERNWLLPQVSAPFADFVQSSTEQKLPVQLVQPAPCVLSHAAHDPSDEAVQPVRYWPALQSSAPFVVHSRVRQVLAVQLLQPFPCAIVHEVHVPGFDGAQPKRYRLPLQVLAVASQSYVEQPLVVQLLHPVPYVLTHPTHDPALHTVQPDRYWLWLQMSAPLVVQSRVEQLTLVQLVQPAP